MITAKWVAEISVKDPDSKNMINLTVYKHEGGGMFAIDSSYLDQVLGDDLWVIPDPFSNNGASGEIEELILEE